MKSDVWRTLDVINMGSQRQMVRLVEGARLSEPPIQVTTQWLHLPGSDVSDIHTCNLQRMESQTAHAGHLQAVSLSIVWYPKQHIRETLNMTVSASGAGRSGFGGVCAGGVRDLLCHLAGLVPRRRVF